MNDVSLKAYDSNGNVVEVEFVPDKISAEVELSSPSKKVSLNFVPTGTMTRGKSIGAYTFSQNSVTIYGDNETLDSIETVDVVVDISKVNSDTTFKAEIKKPSGVKALSDNYVTVSLTVTDSSSEPVRFNNVPLTGINLAPGLSAQPVGDDNAFITVEAQGASSVLSSIDKTDITAYVDLNGLDEGTYTLPVQVKGTNPLATYTAKRTEATIVITKK